MKTHNGLFITLEGSEGSGKSTAIETIKHYFRQKKIEPVFTREPGGTPIAEKIRQVLLGHHSEEKMHEDAELLLMFAARAQHIARVIKPALNAGKLVISDRFTDSSFAYQGGGRGIPDSRIEILENFVHSDLQPDLTILFDVSVEIGLERIQAQRDTLDRFDSEKIEFFQKVREAYLRRASKYFERFSVIDANRSQQDVQKALVDLLDKNPKFVRLTDS